MIKGINSKKITRRKVAKLSALFLLLSLSTWSCKKDKSNLGDSLQSESLSTGVTDTFTILTYSEEIDSMPSDETQTSMLGTYNDPELGMVDCGIVTQLRLSSASPALGTSATTIVDSVVLALRYTGLNFYANWDDVTLEVLEITDDLVRNNQEYYTFDIPNTTGSNLILAGTETMTPDPISDVVVGTDTLDPQLRIHLDPSVGMQMVALNESGDMGSDEAFVSAFKGLYIKANMPGLVPGQGTVLYFSLENVFSEMVMYFHTNSDPTVQEYPFLINTNAARYNVVEYDRTGTDLQIALDNPDVVQEKFYMQGSSVRGLIQFPHLMNFNYDSTGAYKPKIINSAQLILPIQDFEADGFDPATSLFLARVVDNKLSTFTLDYFGSAINTENYDQENKCYTFTMTREIQNVLNGSVENLGYRVYSPSFFASSVERIIFNGPGSNFKEVPRLVINYTEY